MAKSKFNIPDQKKAVEEFISLNEKYSLGSSGFAYYDKLKPVFAFDYLSLEQSHLCFDNQQLKINDYQGFLDGLKRISDKTFSDLKLNKAYRFHTVDFDKDKTKLSINILDFKKALTKIPDRVKDEELPTLYQFDLIYKQMARACGFLYKGVFYLVWFDRDHVIYPGNN